MSWFGILALIQSIVNSATIGPIVFFVGLQINEEALNFMPSRHYSAYIIGLFPSIYDWVVNVSSRSPLTSGDGFNSNYPDGSAGFIGVLGWKRGSLLVSMIWVAMVVMVLVRWKFHVDVLLINIIPYPSHFGINLSRTANGNLLAFGQ